MRESNSSSPRIASCKWRDVIHLTFKSFDACPANSSTSVVRYSGMAVLHTAAVTSTCPWPMVVDFRYGWIWAPRNCKLTLSEWESTFVSASPESLPALPSAIRNCAEAQTSKAEKGLVRHSARHLSPTPLSRGDSNCLSFPSDCPSRWICWSYGHVPQGKPGVRTRVWRTESRFLDEEAPSTPGAWPRPQSGPLCCRQASGLPGSQRLPGPSPQRGRAQEKDDSEDSKDWGCPLFRERKQNGRLYVISLVHLPVQPSRFSFVTSALCRSRTLADSKCPKETARCNKVRPRGSRASTFCKVNTGIYITGYITQKRGKEFQSLIVSTEIKNSICTLKTAAHGKNKCLHMGTNWNVTLGAINKGDSYWVPFAIELRAS